MKKSLYLKKSFIEIIYNIKNVQKEKTKLREND
jgi:hypothetical protein